MGRIHQPSPVLLLLAAFGRDRQALRWACQTAIDHWGPVALTSEAFDFAETDYYESTMGRGLKKIFFAFEQPVDAAQLARCKRQTNRWEEVYAKRAAPAATEHPAAAHQSGPGRPSDPVRQAQRRSADSLLAAPVARPLNLDPGYLTEAKLILASTKDHAHRIYLSHGIYAEVTLHYQSGRWQTHDWTYPDYRREDYHRFFTRCRDYLRRHSSRGRRP